jgi:hypothetical protein
MSGVIPYIGIMVTFTVIALGLNFAFRAIKLI